MKVIEDILKEVDQEVLRKAPHAQRKYNKITETLRVKFLNKIFQENKSIKKAAEELNINYSSAKTILTMHRKKSKTGNSPTGAEMTNVAANIDFAAASQSVMTRALPPKHLIKQSFMSTASNLSEQKDFEDSCSDNHDELKGLNNSHLLKKQFIQNRILVAPQNTTLPTIPIQQKNTSIIIPPPQQQQPVMQTTNQIPAISQGLLLQLQQQFQAQQQQQQQQQQQLQNTLQQLLLIQLAQSQQSAVQQQQPIQPTNNLNPLTTLLLQQQLLGQLPTTTAPIQQKFF